MTSKAKSVLILLATLLIGGAIGVVLTNTLSSERSRKLDLPRQERFKRFMERIIQPTETQQAAIDAVLSKRFGQIAAVHEKCQDQIMAVYDSLQADLASILTEEQRRNLEQELSRGRRKLVRTRVESLTSELHLSEEQKARVSGIVARYEEKFGQLGDHGASWKKRHEDMKALFKQLHQEIESVLTPEQREKYRALKEHRPPTERDAYHGKKAPSK